MDRFYSTSVTYLVVTFLASTCCVAAESIWVASDKGDVNAIEKYIRDGGDVNARDRENGRPVLFYAAANGHLEAIKVLLKHGVKTDVVTRSGYAPVCAAAANGHIDTVKILVDAGASIDFRKNQCDTALMQAAVFGRRELVAYLLENGADITLTGETGSNAAHMAADYGQLEILKMLVDAGADIHVRNGWEFTTLMLAAQQGNPKIVKYLLEKGAKPNVRAEVGSALGRATLNGKFEAVKLLIEAGADVNAVLVPEGPPVTVAAKRGDMRLFKLLMDNGATGPFEHMYINDVAKVGHLEIVKIMLAHCEPMEEGDFNYAVKEIVKARQFKIVPVYFKAQRKWLKYPQSPLWKHEEDLFEAIISKDMERLKEILAGPPLTNKPLANVAVSISRYKQFMQTKDIVKEIYDRTEDPRWKILEATWELNRRIIELKDADAVEALLKEGLADPNLSAVGSIPPIAAAAGVGDVRILEILVKYGGDVNAYHEYDSALMNAVRQNSEKAFDYLLVQGANINEERNGRTALSFAVEHDRLKMADTLLRRGADAHWGTEFGRSLLMIAAENNKTNMMELLLDRGANVEAKNRDGFTAVAIAQSKGHTEVVKLLKRRGAEVDPDNLPNPLFGMRTASPEDVKRALARGADPNGRHDRWGWVVLFEFIDEVGNGDPKNTHAMENVKLLLNHGVDLKNYPLIISRVASNGGDPDERIKVIKLLIEHGADINAQTVADDGGTALMWAAARNDVPIVRWLLENGADPTMRDIHGHDAIFWSENSTWSQYQKKDSPARIEIHKMLKESIIIAEQRNHQDG